MHAWYQIEDLDQQKNEEIDRQKSHSGELGESPSKLKIRSDSMGQSSMNDSDR